MPVPFMTHCHQLIHRRHDVAIAQIQFRGVQTDFAKVEPIESLPMPPALIKHRLQGVLCAGTQLVLAEVRFIDDNAAWLDGLAQRLDMANTFAQRLGENLDPEAVADVALGPLASAETRRAIRTAETKPQALTFLLMAPEFQRR